MTKHEDIVLPLCNSLAKAFLSPVNSRHVLSQSHFSSDEEHGVTIGNDGGVAKCVGQRVGYAKKEKFYKCS
jgi:hypothetical protein